MIDLFPTPVVIMVHDCSVGVCAEWAGDDSARVAAESGRVSTCRDPTAADPGGSDRLRRKSMELSRAQRALNLFAACVKELLIQTICT